MAIRFARTVRPLLFVGLLGAILGYVDEAAAIDRQPFDGHPVSDARPGYGSERSGYGSERRGYGSERQYYGAETLRSRSSRSFGGDPYGHQDSRFFNDGSFTRFDDRDEAGYVPAFATGAGEPGVYPGFGSSTGGSFVYLGDPKPGIKDFSGPKVIDVAKESLDARRAPSSGIEVIYTGGAKIIRISSEADTGAGKRSVEQTRSRNSPLEPWSESWERYCTRAHPDFDPNRGTFVAEDGATRFCTGR